MQSVLRRRLSHAQDLVPLKYGYATTMNRHVGSGAKEAWNYDRLRKQARMELSWFKVRVRCHGKSDWGGEYA
jgi:hypothetical protein